MVLLLVTLLALELIYFRIADRFRIVDKPNRRSSHQDIIRRGGGIIFPVAWIIYSASQGGVLPWFTLGLILISTVSFIDDIREVGVVPRLFLHLLALTLAFYDLGLFAMLPWWGSACCLLFAMATVNAINFMDGINGITGMYALGFWLAVMIFAQPVTGMESLGMDSPFPFIIASLVVFGFFNFRRKALCFAGDVGSISMAYLMTGITLFLVFHPSGITLRDMVESKTVLGTAGFHPNYLFLLAVYGTDSLLTIFHRIVLRENILKGHRSHLYQYLVNEWQLPHLSVSAVYALLQVTISIWAFNYYSSWQAPILIFLLSVSYITLKLYILGQSSLPSQPALLSQTSLADKNISLESEGLSPEIFTALTSRRKQVFEKELEKQVETLER